MDREKPPLLCCWALEMEKRRDRVNKRDNDIYMNPDGAKHVQRRVKILEVSSLEARVGIQSSLIEPVISRLAPKWEFNEQRRETREKWSRELRLDRRNSFGLPLNPLFAIAEENVCLSAACTEKYNPLTIEQTKGMLGDDSFGSDPRVDAWEEIKGMVFEGGGSAE